MDTYTVSTPYGTVTISDGGRKVTFELYSDVRQSIHNAALFGYVQHLRRRGVLQYNVDHLNLTNVDRTLSLTRGKAKLDLVYLERGVLHECELKTSREIGLDVSAQQLRELAPRCQNLIVLVPRGCLEEAATILNMLNLDHRAKIEPYDITEEEG